MKERIFLNSDERDEFYDLTDLIPEMMEAESLSRQFCIDYFMQGLKCDRYAVFPVNTTHKTICEWIMNYD